MKALLLTVGSRGDVQPFVALGSRLRAEGHEPILAAPAMFGDLAAAYSVPFVPLDLDMSEVGAILAGRHGIRHLMTFCQAMGRRAASVLPGATEAAGLGSARLGAGAARLGAGAACPGAGAARLGAGAGAADPGADVVVHHPVLPIGQHLAEYLGVPAVVAQPIPALVPTGEFPSAVWPCRMPQILNRPSYPVARHLTGLWGRRDIARWRRDVLALPSRHRQGDPLLAPDGTPVTVLHSFSRHVLPRPADWPAYAHVTGYWPLAAEPGWSPPRRLAEFLGHGDPVVYLGFGSMPAAQAERLAAAMVMAISQAGARAVVTSLSPELRRLLPASRFLVIRSAPHDWLFPRVHAIVHHGGAGTAAAAVLAGRPQIIWPFGVDQHFWARRLTSLGVAPQALPVRALDGRSLAAAVNRVLGDREMAGRAAELGACVRAEDGLGQAVARLTEAAGARHPVRA
jgi:sterol 3beta-glucosyltransferase